MKNIETFIEKAIKGGWNPYKLDNKVWYYQTVDYDDDFDGYIHFTSTVNGDGRKYWMKDILLDPEAWKAVGKVEEWTHFGDCRYHPVGNLCPVCSEGDYKDKMHRFTDARCEGKTIEEAIKEI